MKNLRHLEDPNKGTCIRQRMKQFFVAALMSSMMLTNLAFVVTGIAAGEEVDLNQPDKLKRIADAAMLLDSLENRGAALMPLFYAAESATPYTGWSKKYLKAGSWNHWARSRMENRTALSSVGTKMAINRMKAVTRRAEWTGHTANGMRTEKSQRREITRMGIKSA